MSNHVHIPYEIIIEILARLPVLSLLRFTPACKLWYSIITNPKFITKHLNRSRERSTAQLLFSFYKHRTSENKRLLINLDDQTHTELVFPSLLRSSSKEIIVVGTCNGLICLADGYPERARHVIIWNPTIRKSVTHTLPKKQHQRPMWFGFVLVENKYKVVNICGPSFGWVEVYEQGGKWRVTECATPPSWQSITTKLTPAVFVLEALHWLTYDITGLCRLTPCSIIVFNMRDEVFGEIVLPTNLLQVPSIKLSITSFDGLLALISHGYGRSGSVGLWVMRDYGVLGYWTKMYDIVLQSCFHKPLGFKKSGEILLQISTYKGAIVFYDPETKSDSSFGIQNYEPDTNMHYFVESLVLLQGRKAVTDRFAHLL